MEEPKKSHVKRHHDYSGANVSGNYGAVADESEEFSSISSKTSGSQQNGSKKTEKKFLTTVMNMDTSGKGKGNDKLRNCKIAQDPCLSGASAISFL